MRRPPSSRGIPLRQPSETPRTPQTVVLLVVLLGYRTGWTRIGRVLPPPAIALALGALVGAALRVASPAAAANLRFDPAFFFFALLPPIVFNAGFGLKKRAFFANFAAIVAFALAGTALSALALGAGTYGALVAGWIDPRHVGALPLIRCLMYGTLLSATDTVSTLTVFRAVGVPPLLHNLVFGESVLNDAASVVLYETLRGGYHHVRGEEEGHVAWALARALVQNSVLSVVVGLAVSLALARTLKQMAPSRAATGAAEASVLDVAVVAVGSYLSYLAAVGLGLSGIVAVFTSGIVHSHYSWHSLAPAARASLPLFVEPLAVMAETFTFVYMGLQVAVGELRYDAGLLLTAVPLCVAARVLNIVPLAWLLGRLGGPGGRPLARIPGRVQAMQVLAGIRGSMAYALVINMPRTNEGLDDVAGNPYLEASTLLVIWVTTVLGGGLTAPAVRALRLDGAEPSGPPDPEWEAPGRAAEPGGDGGAREALLGGGGGGEGPWSTRTLWRNVDDRFMKPIFGGSGGAGRRGGEGEG